MANDDSKRKFWLWLMIALISALLLMGVLMYVGWFDTNTHVDSTNGDDVLENYQIDNSAADTPGEADWQNADGESFLREVTDPGTPTQTPPIGE